MSATHHRELQKLVNQYSNKLIDQFRAIIPALPTACLLCDAPAEARLDFCAACILDLQKKTAVCSRCGLELEGDAPESSCGFCANGDWPITRCVALGSYVEPLASLLNAFKQQRRRGIGLATGRSLSLLLARKLEQEYPEGDWPKLIVPVPLHWRRLLSRGYNQSLEIALILSQQLNLKIDDSVVKRRRATPSQRFATARARRVNLSGAFQVTGRAEPRLALVDDVATTGSTAAALGAVLKRAGAREIHLWCLGRTAKRGS